MKKLLKLGLIGLLSVGLVACSNETTTDEGNAGGDVAKEECAFHIGLVTDVGGIDDKSFNQSSWEGLQRFAEENDATDCISYLQSNSEADYIPNLSKYGDDGYDLIVAVGYKLADAVTEVSNLYPESNFLIIDAVVETANTKSAVFSAEQGSFLAGVAAGLKAKEDGSNKVGFIGGEEEPVIQVFQAGFEQGVLAVNPEAKIYVDYTNSFADDAKGQALAEKQYSAGVSVIYIAAGNAGNGAIKAAKERENAWVVGVDRDQYEDGLKEDGSSVILTSMLKRVDNVTYETAKEIKDGNFKAEVKTYDLTTEGVGCETSLDRNLTQEEIDVINDYAAKIKNGEIEVSATPTIKNGSTN